MKTVVMILSVLIATNVVHGSEDGRRFRQYLQECARTLGVPNVPRTDTFICAAVQDNEILYSNGAYNPEVFLRKLQQLISDPIRLQHAYEIFYKCDKEAVHSGAISIGKTIRFLICGPEIISLFDKP